MGCAIEALPQLTYRHLFCGVHQLGRQSRQRAEHECSLQQVRPRQLQARLIEHEIAVE